MHSVNSIFPLGVLENPLTKSLYNERFEGTPIAPGAPRFLITEDGRYITTEDGRFIVTEN